MGRYSKQFLSLQVRRNIRKYRLIRGYTMQELADMTGLTHGYVRDLECLTIDKTPTLETIGKFADALEIDIKLVYDGLNQVIRALHEAYNHVASGYTINGNGSSFQGSILSLAGEISDTSNYLKNSVNDGILREIRLLKEDLRDLEEDEDE